MARNTVIFFLIFGLAFSIGLGGTNARTESTNYIIWADVFSGGGLDVSTSTSYTLQDTIGEAIILSATSTAAAYGLKAGFRELYADQYLTLSASVSSLDLGTLSNLRATTASHTLAADTNSPSGFTITVSGSTLTSGTNTISATGATAVGSSPGSEQFGFNLVANSAPAAGSNPSGTSPIGSAAGQYGVANSFAFQSGDTVASASVDVNATTYTVSYLANVSTLTEMGTYSTTLTFAATANF
ncbi:MAG: hypothetical protein A3J59_01320 [Candidatus Buchananbacteria bacterium RIFCSPHIGHO2_02_FULL_56_16]|uniref:WxL domain-containing protein n=1 Tax=Candidatus Buchananbacteria bacterium RIFCSPHIGHO2_02_FULL_56_16 TaxID=1797542 RepID=A0A1G1YEF1_9BACT|nr:MAG: hypothetical protein A3J59_01320 [Candidatus Buchananbacteria bacterium RIFCSPHIGHO2_02_FULL_56_16]